MNRIELRGVIVPSVYDDGWMEDYISKGMIIPESRFRSMLAEADIGEPLEVYVNSPGGSVFSAYEMINAVREWKLAHGQEVHVVLGALAASAASVFSIMVADQMKAHLNAKVMFHGASTMTLGGSETHGDTADLLDKINGDAVGRLVTRYDLQPETVAEWFAEGREGWLTAQELQEAGIVGEIIADTSDAIPFPSASIADIEDHGLAIAALLETPTEGEDNGREDTVADGEEDGEGEGEGGAEGDTGDGSEDGEDAPPEDDGEDAGDAGEDEEGGGDSDSGDSEDDGGDGDSEDDGEDGDAGVEDGEEEGEGDEDDGEGTDDGEGSEDGAGEGAPSANLSADYQAGLAVGRDETLAQYAAQVEDLSRRLEQAEAEARRHQSAYDKAVAEAARAAQDADLALALVTARLEEATERAEKYVTGALTFTAAVETWEQAMAACGGDYATAAKQYPQLADEYRTRKRTEEGGR